MEDKHFWPVLGVSLALLVAGVITVYVYDHRDVWSRVSCEGLEVWADAFGDTMGARFFPEEKRLMVWDCENPQGRNVLVKDIRKLAGTLPAQVLVNGEGYSISVVVHAQEASFPIPHFSYANITVVSAVESFESDEGGDFNLHLERELTDMRVNITAGASQWVENPGLFVYVDQSRSVEIVNYTHAGILHNASVELPIALPLGMNYLTLEGNSTLFSWRIEGNSSYNLKTSIELVELSTKVGVYTLRCWLNATGNYSAPVLAMTLPRNGTNDNELLTVMEHLTNITEMGLRCWMHAGVVWINGSAIEAGQSREYLVRYSYRDNTAPRFTSYPDKTTAVGVVWEYMAVAVDPDPADDVAYALLVGPDDMLINETRGVLEWNPRYEGSYRVTIVATDGIGNTTQTFTLVVDDSEWARIREGFWSYLLTPGAVLLVILTLMKWTVWDRWLMKHHEDEVKSIRESSKKV